MESVAFVAVIVSSGGRAQKSSRSEAALTSSEVLVASSEVGLLAKVDSDRRRERLEPPVRLIDR